MEDEKRKGDEMYKADKIMFGAFVVMLAFAIFGVIVFSYTLINFFIDFILR